MSKKIIVSLDGSASSAQIIPIAVSIAKQYGDQILFLNIQSSLRELGYPTVRKAIEQIEDEGVPYEAKIRVGIPAMEIVAETSNEDVRCLVMAKGRGDEEAIGSVSAHVLKLAKSPVLLVPPLAFE